MVTPQQLAGIQELDATRALNTDPAVIEGRVMQDYERLLGKVVLVRRLCGFVQHNFVQMEFSAPVKVRVEVTQKESLVRWTDSVCEPLYEVALLEDFWPNEGLCSLQIQGPGLHLNGKQTEASDIVSVVYSEEKQGAAPAPPPKIYRANAYGGGDLDNAPSVAVFQVDEQLARDIVKFAKLVKENGLYKVGLFDYRAEFLQFDPEADPVDAEEAGEENFVRTDCDCLVVKEGEFFFKAYVKHTSVYVSCEAQPISEMAEHFGLKF